ncbi:penicillin-binding protein 1C [Rhodospirillum rubrum]|uniref:penicillin-binding protein 1C n=1 Tax=Rhodospirillum rubrum TaxID=1085 RepID=UPI001908D488|nr:penicillin-binding protein 1C [Rhodospirillum rubrum]MBK1664358.1 penicillin-binding protein 1C [Rhodospirillum rubrum]MBK1676128.1 penicillin-binding protein 1C [Rhodospirillum rubrum]
MTPPGRRGIGRWLRRLALGGLGLALLVGAGDHLLPPDLGRLTPSTRVMAANGGVLRAFLTAEGAWRLPGDPAAVDPFYLALLQAFEDRRFAYHPGVDPLAVVRALGQWLANGKVISGASTLTMQTVRLLDPRPERTIAVKLVEMVRAVQLEAHLGKTGVLGAYLTLAPFGGNLEGVRAGSLAWLGKDPRRLTPGEAALLVALPQAPEALRPDRHPAAARAARDKVLERAVRDGLLDPAQAREAKAEPVPTTRQPMPFSAPHLTYRLAARAPAGALIATTIDEGLQNRLERLARRVAVPLGPGQSLALLAAESASGRILASVGSPDYLDRARLGAIDMTRAVRSPGSALKPLLYGMAFERHIVHPETLMIDRPTRFGAYTPANFGDAHWGEVSVREALAQSLNVPAVMLLDRLGPLAFAARLQTAGIALRLPKGVERPGLPLALGGLGVRLDDLVGLFAAIDAGGEAPPLRALAGPPGPARRVLEPAAAWQVADILAGSPPPPGMILADLRQGGRTVAFKTGTSYGFRDAWAVGFDGKVTIGVWVGRPDGTPSPGAFGRATAAPLLFQAFEALEGRPPPPRSRPDGVFIGANGDLPPPLRRLDGAPPRAGRRLAVDRDALTIAFPPNGSVLDPASLVDGLALLARGGQRPLTWLVDGRPLVSPAFARTARWMPPSLPQGGSLAVRVSVVDAGGQGDTAQVWIGQSPP